MTKRLGLVAAFTTILLWAQPAVPDVAVELLNLPDFAQFNQVTTACGGDGDCNTGDGERCWPTGLCGVPDCRDTVPRSCRGLVMYRHSEPAGALRGAYVGFSVTNNDATDYGDLWVTLSGFGSSAYGGLCTGSADCGVEEFCNALGLCEPAIHLAAGEVEAAHLGSSYPEELAYYRVGRLGPGETRTAYFLLTVAGPVPFQQVTPTLSVYERLPELDNRLTSVNLAPSFPACTTAADPNVCRRASGELQVPMITLEQLASSAKERVTVSVPGQAALGTDLVVTVVGRTGTLGNVSDFNRDGLQEGVVALNPAGFDDWPASGLELVSSRVRLSGGTSCGTASDCDGAGIFPTLFEATHGYTDPQTGPATCEDQIVLDVACTSDTDCEPWQVCSTGGTPPAGTCWVPPIANRSCLTVESADWLFANAAAAVDYVVEYRFRIAEVVAAPSGCSVDANCAPGQRCLDSSCVLLASPVQPRSSGATFRYSAWDALDRQMVPVTHVTTTLTKCVRSGESCESSALLSDAGGVVTFELALRNGGSHDVAVEHVRDLLPTTPALVTVVPGSGSYNDGSGFTPLPDAVQPYLRSVINELVFPGPFIVPAAGQVTLRYQATVPGTAGTYQNVAYALIGRVIIDETTDPDDFAPAVAAVTVPAGCTDDLQCGSGYYCDADGHCVPEPARVDLLDFTAERTVRGAQLSWHTASEIECGAFTILRCDRTAGECAAMGHHAEVPNIVVPCQDSPAGWTYSALDATAAADAVYSYYLREHSTTGATRDHGPVIVNALATDMAATGASGAQAASLVPVAACAVGGRALSMLPWLLLVGVLVVRRKMR